MSLHRWIDVNWAWISNQRPSQHQHLVDETDRLCATAATVQPLLSWTCWKRKGKLRDERKENRGWYHPFKVDNIRIRICLSLEYIGWRKSHRTSWFLSTTYSRGVACAGHLLKGEKQIPHEWAPVVGTEKGVSFWPTMKLGILMTTDSLA